jgi:hypothetical protein
MEQQLETRTKSAQYAVKRAREIILQNEIMVEKLHQSFGIKNSDNTEDENVKSEFSTKKNNDWHNEIENNFKISTNSKFKKYFQDIINSID